MGMLTLISLVTNLAIVIGTLSYTLMTHSAAQIARLFSLFITTTVVLFLVILLGIGLVT
ncbi:MAG: hypothetical protein R3C14_53335 [Caldilineaceae bacterium]